MKRLIFYPLLIVFLVACSAKNVAYTPSPIISKEKAAQIIEQVLYEQPMKYRPVSVFISGEILGFSDGVSSKTKGGGVVLGNENGLAVGIGSSKTLTKEINRRIYFNSIGNPQLFTKRDWFIIQMVNKNNRVIYNVYTRDENKAKKYIDSINYMRINAPEFGG